MNSHLLSRHRAKKDHAPDSGQIPRDSHDAFFVAAVLLALTAASFAFWFHPLLAALVIATLWALFEIIRSVTRLFRIRARWSRLARRRHAAHQRHL